MQFEETIERIELKYKITMAGMFRTNGETSQGRIQRKVGDLDEEVALNLFACSYSLGFYGYKHSLGSG